MTITSTQSRRAHESINALMQRLGVTLPAAAFSAAVQSGLIRAMPGSSETVIQGFRTCPSLASFQTGLERERQRLAGKPARVLAIGAGPEVAGQSSAYAADITREVLGAGSRIERMEWAGKRIEGPEGEFDLVVSHSLLHFLLDYERLVEFAAGKVARGGGWVMAGESNARYWRNEEMLQAARAWVQSRDKKGLRGVYSRVRRTLSRWSPRRDPSVEDAVNHYLEDRFGIRSKLTLAEIRGVADPYFPDAFAEVPGIGATGLDWERDLPAMLSGFRRDWTGTARAFGKLHPRTLTPEWLTIHNELVKRFPDDGAVFTSCWVKS
jgi:hypothetical protein